MGADRVSWANLPGFFSGIWCVLLTATKVAGGIQWTALMNANTG